MLLTWLSPKLSPFLNICKHVSITVSCRMVSQTLFYAVLFDYYTSLKSLINRGLQLLFFCMILS
nr:MAG TPA: hypothetical protein [Caudoviricetes sp.]